MEEPPHDSFSKVLKSIHSSSKLLGQPYLDSAIILPYAGGHLFQGDAFATLRFQQATGVYPFGGAVQKQIARCQSQRGAFGGEHMHKLDNLDRLFIAWAFFFQVVLIVHFAIRQPLYETYTLKYGWIVYALGILAAAISIILLLGGKHWFFWIGGFLLFLFSAFGYWIDYVAKIQFRNPVRLDVAIPFVIFYLAAVMFYWFPLGRLSRPLWFVYAALFVIGTILNIASH